MLCLSSRRVHLEILHNYSAQSITRGFRRTFALKGTHRIIWIDTGLNIVKAGKDLINTEMKVISSLNLKFESIKFRVFALNLFNSLWEQEYTRRRLTVSWKEQGRSPQVGDVVLFKNEPIYRHPISAARVKALLRRNNGDVFSTTISYRWEVGGCNIIVDRHLHQLYPFLDVETQHPQETIHGLAEDSVAEDLTPEQQTQHSPAQDEFYMDPASS